MNCSFSKIDLRHRGIVPNYAAQQLRDFGNSSQIARPPNRALEAIFAQAAGLQNLVTSARSLARALPKKRSNAGTVPVNSKEKVLI
jgi:hypothetical protein